MKKRTTRKVSHYKTHPIFNLFWKYIGNIIEIIMNSISAAWLQAEIDLLQDDENVVRQRLLENDDVEEARGSSDESVLLTFSLNNIIVLSLFFRLRKLWTLLPTPRMMLSTPRMKKVIRRLITSRVSVIVFFFPLCVIVFYNKEIQSNSKLCTFQLNRPAMTLV
jgi:hypothetical protein